MEERRDGVVEKETVIVERGGGGGIIAAFAVVMGWVGFLVFFVWVPMCRPKKKAPRPDGRGAFLRKATLTKLSSGTSC